MPYVPFLELDMFALELFQEYIWLYVSSDRVDFVLQ